MLTVKDLKEMSPGIFRSGITNTPLLHYEPVSWVAVRGEGMEDWTLYYHLLGSTLEFVASNGRKIFTEELIRKLVPCDDEAFSLYRL